uniref:Polymerase delta-interacting protein 3 n=1 Tax=Cyclopterus lumpus TaxID=8103 RepID=A0A8C3AQJ9_CYCLU
MADVSLDEVIRQRGINLKAPAKRPMFGRGAGVLKETPASFRPMFGRGAGVGKSFDARQKIGANDVRQRLGAVKDAREKLGQKDARFKIRGRGGAGGVQDARQMINSRKQGQTLVPQIQIHASNNLASVNSRQFNSNVQGLTVAPPLKITKTIQVRVIEVALFFSDTASMCYLSTLTCLL